MPVLKIMLFIGLFLLLILQAGCRHATEERAGPGRDARREDYVEIPDQDDVQRAVENLRTDDVKWNCHSAMYYLYTRREEVWPYLVRCLEIDDLQARDAIIRILCETESHKPDEEFIRLILDRIDRRGGLLSLRAHHSTHYDFIAYLSTAAADHHATIAEGIASENAFAVYAATYALWKSGTLAHHFAGYTPAIVARIVDGLMRNDVSSRGIVYNVRTCLMLGDRCLPELMRRASLSGSGTSTLAELLVRAIRDGNREARDTIHLEYAYLESHYLQGHSREPGGIVPLSELLINVRPALFERR